MRAYSIRAVDIAPTAALGIRSSAGIQALTTGSFRQAEYWDLSNKHFPVDEFFVIASVEAVE